MGNQELTRMVREKSKTFRYCPVTGNLPTRITEAGFMRACAKYKDNLKNEKGHRVDHCAVCNGAVPENVEFVKLEDFSRSTGGTEIRKNEESVMATSKKGTCWLCKSSGRAIKNHLGKEVCTTCSIVLSQAKNKPLTVVSALEVFDNLPVFESVRREHNGGLPADILRRLEKLEELGARIERYEEAYGQFLDTWRSFTGDSQEARG